LFNALIPLGNLVVWVLHQTVVKMLIVLEFIALRILCYRHRYRQESGA